MCLHLPQALGPFPLGTRELPYLSSPLAAFAQPDQTEEDLFLGLEYVDGPSRWPTSLAVDGKASWGRFKQDDQGWVTIDWDHIESVQQRWPFTIYSSVELSLLSPGLPSVPARLSSQLETDP